MTDTLRVAVIGVGYLGRIHARIYRRLAGVELVAVVDTDPATAAEIAAENGCAGLTTMAGLAGRVDAVSIAVPTSHHLAVAREFLAAGVHTLLEKPVAPTVAESREIVQLAAAHDAILQVGHLERFNAGVMELARRAASPRFIEVHRLGEFVERATDVDVVTDLMIHDIDIVLSLVPAALEQVAATGTRVITEHVDIANARLEFANGAVANVTASRVSRSRFRRIRVFSEESYLGLNFTDQQLEEVRPGEAADGARFASLEHRHIAVEAQPPLDAELAHFVQCVRTGARPLVSGEDGLVAVEVAERVRTCIRDNMTKREAP